MNKQFDLLMEGVKILIKPDNPETTTSGGLILPDTAQSPCYRGKVIAVGVNVPKESLCHQAMEKELTVIYGKYTGTELEYNKEKYLIMTYQDIYAVVNVPANAMDVKGKDNRI